MAGYMIPEIVCDVCGDRELSDVDSNIYEHRSYLRQMGWVRRMPTTQAEIEEWNNGNVARYFDVCPACQEDSEE